MTESAPLMLSVSGCRGIVGKSLTPDVAAKYGIAAGRWFSQHRRPGASKDHPLHVVIGRDSRQSGEDIERGVIAGLQAEGVQVTRLGILSTPGVAVGVDHLQADGGMVITASHNPSQWNGIKLIRWDAVSPPADEASQMIELFHSVEDAPEPVQALADDNPGRQVIQEHVNRVLALVDKEAIAKAKLSVVVDSVAGAGGLEAKLLLEALGVQADLLAVEPTGDFPHPPEPKEENLQGLCKAMKQAGADVGFAQDPDADRLAIVDEKGTYIGEEYTLALAALAVGDQIEKPVFAANLSTSRMIDDVAAKFGGRVARSAVGEANVAEMMRQDKALIGGEGNGGVIDPRVSMIRDSIVGMALVLELLTKRGKPLSELVSEIPVYVICKRAIDLPLEQRDRAVKAVQQAMTGERVDTQDGVRLDWADRWLHVRPSNTEPIVRIIAEAADRTQSEALLAEAEEAISKAIQ